MEHFIQKLKQNLPHMTKSQQAIGQYALENPDSFLFDTLEDLASRVHVSTTTVIRFARALGYGGFSDMQKSIQTSLLDTVTLPHRFEGNQATYDADHLLKDTFQNDISNLSRTLALLQTVNLDEVIRGMWEAKTLYILGMRSSYAPAHYLASRLMQIRPDVRLIDQPGMMFPELITHASQQDLCVAFMFPHYARYSKTAESLVSHLKERHTKIILITHPANPIAAVLGDVIIPCYVDGNFFKNSLTAPICLCNYLTAAMAYSNQSATRDTLDSTDHLLADLARL